VLGGRLVDTIGWRSIFFVNLPIALAAFLLALKLPPDKSKEDVDPLDVTGTAFAVLSLALLSFGLVSVGDGQRTRGAIALVAAVPAIWFFVRSERTALAPMMPLSLFRNMTFSGANGLTVLLYAALSGALFVLPYLMIDVHGYSATAAGAAFLPFSVLMGIGSRWSGSLVERVGPRLPLVLGPSITAVGYVFLALSRSQSSYWTGVLPGLLVVAIGMTLSVAPLTTTIFDSAPKDKSGTASGINNAAARSGGLLAVAALGLTFGGMTATAIDAAGLLRAYSVVTLSAAVLAGLSALTATMTIRPGLLHAR
jgi:MFS family permease